MIRPFRRIGGEGEKFGLDITAAAGAMLKSVDKPTEPGVCCPGIPREFELIEALSTIWFCRGQVGSS
jgi:hypothetical protein